MGNSCVTGSSKGRSNEGQIHESTRAQTTFKWTIDGFSSLLDKGNGWTYSSVFQIRGLNWYLKLNPRDTKSGDQTEYVSLKLELAKPSLTSGTVVEASFKFLIYDQSYGKHHEEHQGVVALNGNDVSETLFVQKINNICSEPQAYTWNIEDFFMLKDGSTSPEFELCGHKWFINIHPSGSDDNGNYLGRIAQSVRIKARRVGPTIADVSNDEFNLFPCARFLCFFFFFSGDIDAARQRRRGKTQINLDKINPRGA